MLKNQCKGTYHAASIGTTTTSRARHGGIGGLGGSPSPYCHIAQMTAVSFGRVLGNGVCPSVNTITASGFGFCGSADVDNNGTVDDADLLIVLFNFGCGS